ncbi:glycosyl hydrolase family 28 protein [Terriglobus albidus]|uniref:glycosyl hydrolase family 28 protein n=1 Tax=Terriglobus albidus TaxID=1592106 RepID=UPI0021DF9EDD|nr:glycosyl hydrolase family 28 protein [Terriglobus albidus]
MPQNKNYVIQVKTSKEAWRRVDCYEPEVDMRSPARAAMAAFDFTGKVRVSIDVAYEVHAVRVRPASLGVNALVRGRRIEFELAHPANLSIELNGDTHHNLHLFAGSPNTSVPEKTDDGVHYFGPGLHHPGDVLRLKSGESLYLAPGAVVVTSVVCDHVSNVHIFGKGILWHAKDGIRIDDSKHVLVEGVTVMNPDHYSVLIGNSSDVTVRNMKSFSSKGWGDGIDIFTSKHILVDGVFMRNSDDAIAIYGHRWNYYGDTDDITVSNSTLWADVAHPILAGTHGDSENPEIIEHLTFRNIDVLQQNEPQIDYQGCLALNASDGNLIRHVFVDGMRVESIENGQLLNVRVTFNRKYAKAPGRGIEDVYIKDLSYSEGSPGLSIINGYDESHMVRSIKFENLRIGGNVISDHMAGKPPYYKTADMAEIFVGDHVEDITFITTEEAAKVTPVTGP